MRNKNKSKFVKVDAVFTPSIKTLKEATIEANGRSRQYIEQQDLTWGVILYNKNTGDNGTKVIVCDDKYNDFIEVCHSYDNARSIKKRRKSTK